MAAHDSMTDTERKRRIADLPPLPEVVAALEHAMAAHPTATDFCVTDAALYGGPGAPIQVVVQRLGALERLVAKRGGTLYVQNASADAPWVTVGIAPRPAARR